MFKLCLQAQIEGLFVLSYILLMLGQGSHEDVGEGTTTIGAGSCCSNRFRTTCRTKCVFVPFHMFDIGINQSKC